MSKKNEVYEQLLNPLIPELIGVDSVWMSSNGGLYFNFNTKNYYLSIGEDGRNSVLTLDDQDMIRCTIYEDYTFTKLEFKQFMDRVKEIILRRPNG